METIKTNTELLKEMQDLSDEHKKIKEEIEILLKNLDEVELKYSSLVEKIKNKK